ncbi:Response regulator transcription factor [Rhodovastum atsumiense]|uniref:Response regulator transcription factor n=1 Tax=Rhodovastum atsumiense TaxID=504468 RepID=A0A5M6IPQ2_9PROT|nr:response regulator transcription factor [Rhodovastum atsumiense]KAA5609445.1 response regulator transcription factor [Rhodovastum atsumiense]CAH2603525.1 Response regulator transcription factor [Rhodovastum atsumiense]
MSGVRVLLADDHPVVLAGMKALLTADSGLEVVGEARDGRTTLQLAEDLQPDVVVLDLSMPGLNGAEVARQLRADCPRCKVLVLSVHEDRSYVRELLDGGAVGYVLKRSAAEELLRGVHAVADGGVYLDPAIAARAVGSGPARPREAPMGRGVEPRLSEREVAVLRLTAAGHSNKTIATRLRIGVKSVETYKSRAMDKLGFHSRVEVLRYALGKGWLEEC